MRAYMRGMFDDLFEKKSYFSGSLLIQCFGLGAAEDLPDIGADHIGFRVELGDFLTRPFVDLAARNELAEVGGDRQAGQFTIGFQQLKLLLCQE